MKPIESRLKEIIKMKREIKEIRETKTKINEIRSWFFENINKIDKPLAGLITKGERVKFTEGRNKIGHYHIDTVNIKRITKECHGQYYINKFET